MDGIAELDAAAWVATSADPFVRHQVHVHRSHRVLVRGRAAVADANRDRTGPDPGRPTLWCLGPPGDLDPLLAHAVDVFDRPDRISIEATSYDALPSPWRVEVRGHWHWMLTRAAPPPQPGEDVVGVIDDPDAVTTLLDAANPAAFLRPGDPGEETWLGVRAAGGVLACAGTLYRDPDGTGHLRSVTTHPDHRGLGLATAVSAALTRVALGGASGAATLGVYVDNAPALTVYERLGYRTHHTFRSGSLHDSAGG
ncbi:GNAT family N-acetyltransferase [Nocardioides acrostichi]|uniref:GNAT family N-acetyltransferase n=1 Tax=Nocardioides acrostichi TaxID=2784339 RepID=A0A930UXX2_9ACTN|nr:GNAT family N-acetyltransferase [Nocardioides acrostichi]MBF4160291.1 GNAT family N-acetyltransferase [Nocardioides acrostichi]